MDAHGALWECLETAESYAQETSPAKGLSVRERERSNYSFLAANYQKKDRKAKQAALFPELEEAVEKGYKEMERGVDWPDQESEKFKEELERRSERLMGPTTTARQRSSLVTRILRPFSMCFWILGRYLNSCKTTC